MSAAPSPADSRGSIGNAQQQQESQPQERRRRNRRKNGNGPPQLQFLTATDPSQFKDEKAKRSVRSQAMIQYRYKSAEEKRTKPAVPRPPAQPVIKTEPVDSPGILPRSPRVSPILLNEGTPRQTRDAFESQWKYEPDVRLYASTTEAWYASNVATSGEAPSSPALESFFRSLRESQTTSTSWGGDRQRITDHDESEDTDDDFFQRVIARHMSPVTVGNGADPFITLPKFSNPSLREQSFWLVRRCNRTFSTASTLQKWLPAMLSHPHVLLSSTIVASTWLDMHQGISGESRRTQLIKAEILEWIKQRVSKAATQYDDSTMIVIIHVLAGEMWSCNEKTLRIHQNGIAKLIECRGGMDSLGGHGTVAATVASVCYHTDILCEMDPLPMFAQWNVPPLDPLHSESLPESPLFCLQADFTSFSRGYDCSERTYKLLCDMRTLTDLFIAQNVRLDNSSNSHFGTNQDSERLSSLEYNSRVAEIRARLAALPSAADEQESPARDAVFEACRITAIIYASAIITRQPFSAAGDPSRNVIMLDASIRAGRSASEHAHSPHLTTYLYSALEKTNIGDIWQNMAGVFYWVTVVGAAAARTSITINTYQKPTSMSEAYATWVRRCIMLFSTRALILQLFEHPIPILFAQKKLLLIQELINPSSTRLLR